MGYNSTPLRPPCTNNLNNMIGQPSTQTVVQRQVQTQLQSPVQKHQQTSVQAAQKEATPTSKLFTKRNELVMSLHKINPKFVIKFGDTVVFARDVKTKRPLIFRLDVLEGSEGWSNLSLAVYNYTQGNTELNELDFAYIFNTDTDLMQFCMDNCLVIANELKNVKYICDKFWALVDTRYCKIDDVLFIDGTFVDLCFFVTARCVSILDSIFGSAHDKDYVTTEFGTGSYNEKGKCFHFSPYRTGRGDYTLSFELGTTEPTSDILFDYDYDWRSDLNEFGVCITRASMHAYKKYKTDKLFYAK